MALDSAFTPQHSSSFIPQQRAKAILELCLQHCQLEKYIARTDLKQNGNCRFCGAEDERLKHPTSNFVAITEIRYQLSQQRSHIQRGGTFSESITVIALFIKARRLNGEL